MPVGDFIKKGQGQVAQVAKKVNYLTVTSYDTTLLLHALCRIEESFDKKFKYETNLAGYDGSLGTITIYVENAHEITKILTLIDTCEPINDKLLSRDLDFSATVTNNADQVENYHEVPVANAANPFLKGWKGLSVEDKKQFIRAFELLDKGNVSDLALLKQGISNNEITVEDVYGDQED